MAGFTSPGGGTLAPERTEEERLAGQAVTPWVTLVWDDPVNLMSYVTYVFQKLLGHSKRKAHELMLDVHEKGRAAVSSGSREQMEHDATRLQAAGLWATVAQD